MVPSDTQNRNLTFMAFRYFHLGYWFVHALDPYKEDKASAFPPKLTEKLPSSESMRETCLHSHKELEKRIWTPCLNIEFFLLSHASPKLHAQISYLILILIFNYPWSRKGFPGATVVKNSPASAGSIRDMVQSLGWQDSLE